MVKILQKSIAQAILILILISSAFVVVNLNTSLAATTDPVKLKIFVGPSSVLADNNTYNCIFVQLQDINNKPARALQDTTISLSSSTTSIGTVDPSITILKGTTYTSANFSSTFSPGASTISASATGYATVQASITTIGPIPSSVAVYGFPSTLPADGGSYNVIMVQLQDLYGVPAKAPKGGVLVSLSCSNTSIGTVSPNVTIAEGKTYVIATFNTTTAAQQEGRIKSVIITTVAQGYTSQQVTMTITPIATNPNQLKIFSGPTQIPADQTSYQQIAVELQNSVNGYVGVFPSDVIVSLGSSDPTIGKIDSQLIIPQGQTYAVATLNSTYKAGPITLTAVATDLLRSQQTITTTGFTPTKLAVYCSPASLPSDNGAYQSIQVQLQDSQGRPAKDPQTDVSLSLFSSLPTVGTVDSILTIPFGQTQATGTVTVTNTAGTTTITAQGSSYTTGQGTLTTFTIDFLPVQISATANSTSIYNGQKTDVVVYITADGINVPGATVQFGSDNGGSFTATSDIGNGYYKTTFTAPSFTQATTCTITATAVKTGYVTSQATTQVSVSPPPAATPAPTATPKPSPTPTPTASTKTNSTTTSNTTGIIQLRIEDYAGNPLSNATISSTVQPTGTNVITGVTNSTGYVIFTNVTTGQYSFNITRDGYEGLSEPINFKGSSTSMALALTAQSGSASSSGSLSTTLILVVVVVIVLVLVVGLLLVKRRRSNNNKLKPFSSANFKLSYSRQNLALLRSVG
jgi:cell division septation protein DedD